MPESGYQVLNSDREEEVQFQFTPNVARSNKINYIFVKLLLFEVFNIYVDFYF